MEGHVLMSSKERERLKVLARVKRGELNLKEAAELLSISYRQCRRLHKRHQESGDRGLVHGIVGGLQTAVTRRSSNRRCWLAIRSAIRTLDPRWQSKSWLWMGTRWTM